MLFEEHVPGFDRRSQQINLMMVVVRFLHGKRSDIDVDKMYCELDGLLDYSIENRGVQFDQSQRIMIISNHPSATRNLLLHNSMVGLVGDSEKEFLYSYSHVVINILLLFFLLRLCNKIGIKDYVVLGKSIGLDSLSTCLDTMVLDDCLGNLRHTHSAIKNDINKSIVIFPEGRRADLESFQSGFLGIARHIGAQIIIPVIMSPVIDPTRQFRMVIHKPIVVAKFDIANSRNRKLSAEELRKRMVELYSESDV
jgi:hypothetical protein